MIILAFDTEGAAVIAEEQIWVNIIAFAVDTGCTVIDAAKTIYTDLTGLSENEIAALRICGARECQAVLDCGLTYRFGVVLKAYEHDNWYIPSIDAEFLTGVVDYTQMTLPDSWKPPLPPWPGIPG